MTTKTPKPQEIRIGRIKAVVFKNETKNGDPRFNTTFKRVYRVSEEEREGPEDSGWRETGSFGRDDLLILSKLANEVHSWIHDQNEPNRDSREVA